MSYSSIHQIVHDRSERFSLERREVLLTALGVSLDQW
jgi:hypothetical protein